MEPKLNFFQNPNNGNWCAKTSEGMAVVKADKASNETEAAAFISKNEGKRIINAEGVKTVLFGYSDTVAVAITSFRFTTEDVPTDVSAIAKAL